MNDISWMEMEENRITKLEREIAELKEILGITENTYIYGCVTSPYTYTTSTIQPRFGENFGD